MTTEPTYTGLADLVKLFDDALAALQVVDLFSPHAHRAVELRQFGSFLVDRFLLMQSIEHVGHRPGDGVLCHEGRAAEQRLEHRQRDQVLCRGPVFVSSRGLKSCGLNCLFTLTRPPWTVLGSLYFVINLPAFGPRLPRRLGQVETWAVPVATGAADAVSIQLYKLADLV